MTTIQKLFGYSVRWNILESVSYQTLLFGHQCALYHILSTAEYGTIGTLFSLVYLAVAIFNFGLDSSISPFFLHASQSKNAAYHSLLLPSIIHATLLGVIAIIGVLSLYYRGLPSFMSHLTPLLLLLMAFIFISEALKKTLRTMLHCAFKNSITTTIELVTITSYISAVWTVYVLGYRINLYTLFIPMAITSIVSLILLLKVTYDWYQGLPQETVKPIAMKRILFHRLCAYGSQLTTVFFSANFLVPLFAWKFGIHYAALLKLISYLNYYIHTIMHKVFGVSLQACFAAIKNKPIEIKKQFFNSVTQSVYQFLYGIALFCTINGSRIIALKHTSADQSIMIVGYLFFIALLVENFLISYEQLYQAEEKTGYISTLNIINIMLLFLVANTHFITHPAFFLLFFISVRLCTIASIAIGAFYFWRIHINLRPHIQPALGFIALSFFFFLITS